MSAEHATEQTHHSESALSNRDLEILASSGRKYAGSKEQAIKELFDMSSTRYYQVLNALLDTPAALEADPMLIKRLPDAPAASGPAPADARLQRLIAAHLRWGMVHFPHGRRGGPPRRSG